MSESPKRKSENEASRDEDSKKARIEDPNNSLGHSPSLTAPPDSYIDHEAAIKYWSSTEPTINGVLGGYPQVSRIDIQGSSNFLTKLRRKSTDFPPAQKLKRALDCGAGIGRITDGLLSNVAETVDIVEPVKQFTDQIKATNIGKVYNIGLEAWNLDTENQGVDTYDLIWNQWCVGQLTDAQLVACLKRQIGALSAGGWIVVKENLSNDVHGEDVYDETDSSVTRTEAKFVKTFADAGLKIVASELQRGMPSGLYPIKAWALQPKSE